MNQNASYWNERAGSFRKEMGEYERQFLKMADIHQEESIFDMGCASGTLAIPLAEKGCRVLACDFSEEMIHALKKEAKKKNLTEKIDARLLDWNEDWSLKNLHPCDVAIASRSLLPDNVEELLRKLETMAKKRVIVTSPTGYGQRVNIHIAEELDVKMAEPYLDIIKILHTEGVKYELSFIKTEKQTGYESKEDCYHRLFQGFEEGLDENQKKKLARIVDDHYLDGRLNLSWPVKWAYITWRTE